MFNQMKQITKASSSQKTDHVITNILIRIQEEATCKASDAFKSQESEVEKLAKALGKRQNSIIPFSWIEKTPTHYQAHLERISDFLLLGKSAWWTRTSDGIEFLDGATSPTSNETGPCLHHYRTATLSDVDCHLQKCWEECVQKGILLPAITTRVYTESDRNPLSLLQLPPHTPQVQGHPLPRTQAHSYQEGQPLSQVDQTQTCGHSLFSESNTSRWTFSLSSESNTSPWTFSLSNGSNTSPCTLSLSSESNTSPWRFSLSNGSNTSLCTLSLSSESNTSPWTFSLSNGSNTSPCTFSLQRIKHKPVEILSLQRIKHKPVYTLFLQRIKHKPVEILSLQRIKHKPVYTLSLQRIKHKPVDILSLRHIQHKPVDTLSLQRIKHKPVDTLSLQQIKHKPMDTLSLRHIQLKPVDTLSPWWIIHKNPLFLRILLKHLSPKKFQLMPCSTPHSPCSNRHYAAPWHL